MTPLILEYAETPTVEVNMTDQIEYHPDLNLNVIKGTNQPAINETAYNTETFTKAQVDTAESDDDYRFSLNQFLDTRLQTRAQVDDTANDDDAYQN